MMDRVAVFVDAGYLFAQGSVALCGQKRTRSEIRMDIGPAVAALQEFAHDQTGLPMLRIYWYDGTSTGPTSQHLALANTQGIKVRLGFVNSVGEQKGVDSLIVTDMITLARNRAMADAVLLSGDEDLRVGVQQAQELGVRVHLLGIHPSRGSQSAFLLQEADTTREWGPADLTRFLAIKPPVETATNPADTPPPPGTATDALESVALDLAAQVPPSDLEALVAAIDPSGPIPRDIDARLLGKGGAQQGATRTQEQKTRLRNAFRVACRARLTTPAG